MGHSSQQLIGLRANHPAWLLLSARSGPALIATLQSLFDEQLSGIEMHAAQQALAEQLRLSHERGEIDSDGDYHRQAGRELREWIRRGLILERDARIVATDALESVFRFIDGLDNRVMTSTASRLSVVQRELENLELRLSPDPKHRSDLLKRQIADLQRRLKEVESGEMEMLDADTAVEAIREVYNLAMGLRQDFRRVEDSYREADRRLRETVIARESDRGQVVDTLLDSHDALLQTDEGKVFDAFQQQLKRNVELQDMRQHIRALSHRPETRLALNDEQHAALRNLFLRLTKESNAVIQARARGERDLQAFMHTNLASEHHRVGQLLNALFDQAARMDWSRQATRREDGPLPPLGFPNARLPLIERLRFKDVPSDDEQALDLLEQNADLNELDQAFWDSFDTLDRQALLAETRRVLSECDQPLSIAELTQRIGPEHYAAHDLEAFTLWLTLAMEDDQAMDKRETLELTVDEDHALSLLFELPRIALSTETLDTTGVEL